MDLIKSKPEEAASKVSKSAHTYLSMPVLQISQQTG